MRVWKSLSLQPYRIKLPRSEGRLGVHFSRLLSPTPICLRPTTPVVVPMLQSEGDLRIASSSKVHTLHHRSRSARLLTSNPYRYKLNANPPIVYLHIRDCGVGAVTSTKGMRSMAHWFGMYTCRTYPRLSTIRMIVYTGRIVVGSPAVRPLTAVTVCVLPSGPFFSTVCLSSTTSGSWGEYGLDIKLPGNKSDLRIRCVSVEPEPSLDTSSRE